MKSLIVFAFAIHLVSVQGSGIIQEDLDYEYMHDDGFDYSSLDNGDAITAKQNLAYLHDMGSLRNAGQVQLKGQKPSLQCNHGTCSLCTIGLCLGITNVENSKLKVYVAFREHLLYEKTIMAKDWSRCHRVKFSTFTVTPCLTLSKVRILKDKICITASIGISFFPKKSQEICL